MWLFPESPRFTAPSVPAGEAEPGAGVAQLPFVEEALRPGAQGLERLTKVGDAVRAVGLMYWGMSTRALLPDALWQEIAPLLPAERPKPKGGRPRVPDRAALTGILFVLRTGIPWEYLPAELGCGSGMTCWRRLRDWQAAGVWEALRRRLLDRLGAQGRIDLEPGEPGRTKRPGKKGGPATGPNPTDRGKPGSKRHLLVDREGTPLALKVTAANVNEVTQLEAMVTAIPAIKQRYGYRRKRPDKLHADKGYDARHCRRFLRRRHITPRIARRGIESSTRLGRYRWVVERTNAWVNQFRRLVVRYERRLDIHTAFTVLACALICWKQLQR